MVAIIDLDSHLREEYFLDEVYELAEPFVEYTPKRIGTGLYQEARFEHRLSPWPESANKAFNHSVMYDPKANWHGGDVARRQVGGYDMEYRLKDNQREGVDVQFLFPTQISIPTMNAGPLGAALCRAYNNWVHKLVRGYENRLFPVAMAPAGCPEAMADELRRCVTELGFKAAHLVPYTHERTVDDPAFYPYYEAAQELDIPLFCHPNTQGELINRYNNFFAMHVLGRPLNCTAALVALVVGGIFERFPRLKVVFFECSAEWIIYWMHRMDDDYRHMQHGFAPHISTVPSEYVRANCYVTCEADEKSLPLALHELGETHVVMATDYPHFDSEWPDTVRAIREREDLTERQKRLILEENALQLVKL